MGIKNSESLIRDKSKQYKIMDFLKKYGASAKWLKWVEEDFGIKIERASNKKENKPQDNPVEQVEPIEKQVEQKEVVDSLNKNLEVVIDKLKQVETMYNSLKEEVNRVKSMKDEVEKTV